MPWLTSKLIKCINKKHKWLTLLKQKIITYESFKVYSALLSNVLSIAETQYYRNSLASSKGDQKKHWKIINNLLGKYPQKSPLSMKINDVDTEDVELIANSFNNYFVTIPRDLQTNLAPSNLNGLSYIPWNDSSMYFEQCTQLEVTKFISELKCSNGVQGVSAKMLRLGRDFFSPILCKLFNMSLDRVTYPDSLKLARVIPVHKSGPKNILQNFRPISILSCINKVYEKIIHSRLSSFFDHCHLLSINQFGFRNDCTTESDILQLVNNSCLCQQ